MKKTKKDTGNERFNWSQIDAIEEWLNMYGGDGHSIYMPFCLGSFPVELEERFTKRYESQTGDPKATLYVDGKTVWKIEGVYGLEVHEAMCMDLGVPYMSKMGRGFQAQACVQALRGAIQQRRLMTKAHQTAEGEVDTAGCALFDYAARVAAAAKLDTATVIAAEIIRNSLTPEQAERLPEADKAVLCEAIQRIDGAKIELARVSDDEETERRRLEAIHGKGYVWNTQEMQERFQVEAFRAPSVVVRERSTGKVGTLYFQHNPRFYWGWESQD